MPTAKRKKKKRKAKNAAQVNCKELQQKIDRLGKYFDVCSGVLQKDTTFWFRGQADVSWPLTPSALRFDTSRKQQKAFELLDEFKRLAHMKLKNPPASSENLQWMQLARHYGLPTPLMDWTTNAGIALYFACNVADDNQDGGVFIMNPVSLNQQAVREARIFDSHSDAEKIKKYFKNTSAERKRLPTIAIKPVWNSNRIVLQQGFFTLHGLKNPTLTMKQAQSLIYLRILHNHKQKLLEELERVGINEMTIFPEPEHTCSYLVWREGLTSEASS